METAKSTSEAVERLLAAVRLCVHCPTSVDVPSGPRGRPIESQYERWTLTWHSRTRSRADSDTPHLQPGVFLDPLNCARPQPWSWLQGAGVPEKLDVGAVLQRGEMGRSGEVPVGCRGAEMAVRSCGFAGAAERTPCGGASAQGPRLCLGVSAGRCFFVQGIFAVLSPACIDASAQPR